MSEKKIITDIINCFRKSPLHLNDFFSSDSEIIQIGDKRLLFTTDDFSSEDFFDESDLFLLGRNLAVATLSDILACCGKPLFYAHSMVIDKKWDSGSIKKFSEGIASVINENSIAFIGGDLGTADKWRYTGIAIGQAQNLVTRQGAKSGDYIYMTGNAGAGNLQVAYSLFGKNPLIDDIRKKNNVSFLFRGKESELIAPFASACTDSSDGIINGLKNLSEFNKLGFEVSNIPVCNNGREVCNILKLPEELLLIGECGEYELLFTVSSVKNEEFVKIINEKKFDIHCIGRMTSEKKMRVISGNNEFCFEKFDLSARDFENVELYLKELINFLPNNMVSKG